MNSDIIIRPGTGPERLRKGRIIKQSLNVVATQKSLANMEIEEELIKKVWPDWEERILDMLNFRYGKDKEKLFESQADNDVAFVVGNVMAWAGIQPTETHIKAALVFLSGYLGFNFENPLQPNTFNARTAAKATLLFILSQIGANADGFRRDQLKGPNSPYALE